jgi:hypothetical protein
MRFLYAIFCVLIQIFVSNLLMRFRAFLLMRFRAFWPLWGVLLRVYSFWCTIRFFMLCGRYEISCFFAVMRFPYEISCFWLPNFSFWWCDVRTVERWVFKDVGDCMYIGRCVVLSVQVGWFVGGGWMGTWVVVGASASVSVSALGNRRVCVEVVWFVSPACITPSRYACLGDVHAMLLWFKEVHSGVWVGEVLYITWRMSAFLGLSQCCDQGSSFCLLFLRVDCECNRASFLATVFFEASAFNGDLNQWDVAKVTSMHQSKSIHILENALTWRSTYIVIGGFSRGLGLMVMMWSKFDREVGWRMWAIFLWDVMLFGLMRFHETSLWYWCFFGCYEISLWDFMFLLHRFLVRLPYDIS